MYKVLAVLLGVTLAGPAVAADLRRPAPLAPISPAAFDWSGLYVGVHGGGGWAQQTPDTPAVFDMDGPFVGGQLGVNFVVNRLLLGLEADIAWSGIDGVRVGGGGIITTHDLDWFGTARGRIGIVNADWLFYGTGGFAFGDATRTNSTGAGGVASATVAGWTAGLGAERVLGNNWTLKGEYKYLDFGTDAYTYVPGGATTNVDLTAHTFQIGLNKHF